MIWLEFIKYHTNFHSKVQNSSSMNLFYNNWNRKSTPFLWYGIECCKHDDIFFLLSSEFRLLPLGKKQNFFDKIAWKIHRELLYLIKYFPFFQGQYVWCWHWCTYDHCSMIKPWSSTILQEHFKSYINRKKWRLLFYANLFYIIFIYLMSI